MIVFNQFLLVLPLHMSPKYFKISVFPNAPYSFSSVLLDDQIHLLNLDNPTQFPLIFYFPFQNSTALLLLFIFCVTFFVIKLIHLFIISFLSYYLEDLFLDSSLSLSASLSFFPSVPVCCLF